MKTKLFPLILLFGLAQTHAAPRIATSDWTVSETLTAIGAPPLAAGDKVSYQKWVGYPKLPENVADFGVRMQPNVEYLARLRPDLFIQTAFYMGSADALRQIAPVHQIDMADERGITWDKTVSATRELAKLAQRSTAAEQFIAQTENQFAQQKRALHAHAKQPVAVVQFINARQVRIYGSTSLFHVVLGKLGLQNAWTGASNQWGFTNIALADLARLPENTLLIVVKPHPTDVGHTLRHSALWQRLPMSRNHRVLPAVWAYGGLSAMARFGDLTTNAILHGKQESW